IAVRARGDIDYDLSLWHHSIFAQAIRAAKGNCRNQAISLIVGFERYRDLTPVAQNTGCSENEFISRE
ncbi:MAG TPA: hypothetical protein VN310_19065, partial [Candidatus Dormibacteraeota bacterium]|nr:hypothetical protein [Candidatus Dormibacteraeota bacterium]